MVFAESEVVELKSKIIGDICKEIIAFANTKGGTLYIGVEDDGNIIGVEDVDQVTLQLSNMVRDSIKPDVTMFVHYETLFIAKKNIIAVTIQKGTDRPYYLESIVRSDVDKLLNVSAATANRILNHMVNDGLIYKEGSGRKQNIERDRENIGMKIRGM